MFAQMSEETEKSTVKKPKVFKNHHLLLHIMKKNKNKNIKH